jgi:hypothetical protein
MLNMLWLNGIHLTIQDNSGTTYIDYGTVKPILYLLCTN